MNANSRWSDQAIVLRVGHFREADLWLKLLLRRHGLQTVFAFGASKSRRRFCGCLDVFNTFSCNLCKSGNGKFLNLTEASLLSGPRQLRRQWQRMGLGTNCLKFMEAFGVDEQNASENFALLENLRELLENSQKLPELLPHFFRLRLGCAQGLAPNFHYCGLCGTIPQSSAYFWVNEGQIVCTHCHANATISEKRYSIRVSAYILDLLRSVQQTLPSGWPKDELRPEHRSTIARVISAYVQYHLGLTWAEGRFRRI